MNIAIDGPAGAGKSTIARIAAKRLDFLYVDTGALYRAIGLYLLEKGTDIADETALKASLDEIEIEIRYEEDVQHVILNGHDVSKEIRNEKVGIMASKSAALLPVREKLLSLQRDIASKNDVLMDGRDIGTNILPSAELKIYLTASVEVRADRRYKELVEKGQDPDYEVIKKDIEERDHQDMTRAISPLKQADDAVLLDSSDMTIEEVVEKIISLADERM